MSFPKSPRVIYRRHPLDTVICQLRFPSILKIDTEIPSQFQDLIREEYPLYKEKLEGQPEIPVEIVSHLPAEAKNLLSFPGSKKNYEFTSHDELWTVNLTSSFFALTTRKYDRWESFRNQLSGSLDALLKVYKPAFFSRVGLRYRDIIKRSELGLEDVPWSELLQPHIAGILSASEMKNGAVQSSVTNTVIQLADGKSFVRIVHGLVESKDTSEIFYLIDSDFFLDSRTETNYALERLDYFNARGTRLIRWSITDRLHTALEPEPIR